MDPFTLDTYVIGRPDRFALDIGYDCYDKDGNALFDIKHGFIEKQHYELIDSTKRKLGAMKREAISITPVFNLFDAQKQFLGKVVEELNVSMSTMGGGTKTFVLEDSNKQKIAKVSITSPLARLVEGIEHGESLQGGVVQGVVQAGSREYEITSMDGTVTYAKIGIVRTSSPTMITIGRNRASYVLNIIDKTIPALVLIEFTIAVDHLYSSTHAAVHHVGPGFAGPGHEERKIGGGEVRL